MDKFTFDTLVAKGIKRMFKVQFGLRRTFLNTIFLDLKSSIDKM